MDGIEIQIIVSNRRSLALEITRRAEVLVRAPHGISESSIHEFVRKKIAWIRKKILLMQQHRVRYQQQLVDGSRLLFLGKEYPLSIQEGQIRPLFFLNGFFLPAVQKHRAKHIIIDWYRFEAAKYITKRVRVLSERHKLHSGRIRITSAMTRWGSCAHNGNLNFSWRIMMAPSWIVEYVIAHELAHLTVKNHSKLFWQRLDVLYPEHKKAHQWLKDHGSRLHIL